MTAELKAANLISMVRGLQICGRYYQCIIGINGAVSFIALVVGIIQFCVISGPFIFH